MTRNPTQYTAVKYDATGIFGYSIRKDGIELGNISCPVLPQPDITLSGFGSKLWHRKYDNETTLQPGIRRVLVDAYDVVQGYYEYTSLSTFDIVTETIRAHVNTTECGWEVCSELCTVAKILRLPTAERTHFAENGFDMENRFLIDVFDSTDHSLLLLIMAIPMLGF